MMFYDGKNGATIELLDDVLVVRRNGIGSALAHGLKGDKRIPYASITSVQFKEPGMTSGYIQFGLLGGIEGRGGVFNAAGDENTVLFLKEASEEFRWIRDEVERRAAASRRGGRSAPVPAVSVTDELSKLADLRDRGVLTEAEFDGQKQALLRGDAFSHALGTSGPPPRAASVRAGLNSQPEPEKKSSVGKKLGAGCLVIVGIFILLAMLGSNLESQDKGDAQGPAGNVTGETGPRGVTSVAKKAESAPSVGLFGPQANAVRSAKQYLDMTGFSHRGLIEQLSSDAGSGYSFADATAAVDSLTVDWNAQAARSAKQYLDMTGFSCNGLIEQLSSNAGSKYTKAQARYGAEQAGAC